MWHIAALVGPYFERQAYYNVNYTCVLCAVAHTSIAVSLTQRFVRWARSGTLNVIEACKQHKARTGEKSSSQPVVSCTTHTASCQVRKIVMSSSPSTRFDGNDICGKAADELPIRCGAFCLSPLPLLIWPAR